MWFPPLSRLAESLLEFGDGIAHESLDHRPAIKWSIGALAAESAGTYEYELAIHDNEYRVSRVSGYKSATPRKVEI